MSALTTVAAQIIKQQALVIGPLAWSEARKVPGLSIIDISTAEIVIGDTDEKKVIDLLVARYERLFGETSHEVCREAVASLVAQMSPADIPMSLR